MKKLFTETEELIKTHVLNESDTQTIIHGEECSIYKMENNTGEGIIIRYSVFPGIEILYNDIHMKNGVRHNATPRADIIEINHCRIGRFECEFSNGETAYLGEGDLAVNVMTNVARESWFPLSHYHGITIAVDISLATQVLKQVSNALGRGLSFDLFSMKESLCQGNSCFIMRATDSIQHIFSELYKTPEDLKSGYFKIKVMELFLFLNSPEITAKREERQYFNKIQIESIKAIRQYLIQNLHRHVTLKELSHTFNYPLTSMKLCFKEVYGSSINTYMQAYRVQFAAQLLRESNDGITNISYQVGYQNASKFSEVFKQFIGQTPTEYRKSFCLKGGRSVL